WNTQRGCCSVSSRSDVPGGSPAPPESCASPRAASRVADRSWPWILVLVVLVPFARGGLHLQAFVLPGVVVVGAVLLVQAGEDLQVLGVGEVLGEDGSGVGVRDHVVPEVLLVGQDVVDDPAEERDIGSGP